MKIMKKTIILVTGIFMLLGFVEKPKAVSIGVSTIYSEKNEKYVETKYEIVDSDRNKEYAVEKMYQNGDIRFDVYSFKNILVGTVIKDKNKNIVTVYEPDRKPIIIPIDSGKLESLENSKLLEINPLTDWVYSSFRSSYFTSAVYATSIGLLASTIVGVFNVAYGFAVDLVTIAIANNMNEIFLEKRYRTKIKVGGSTIIEEGWVNSYRNSDYTNLYNTRHYTKLVNP